MVGTGRRVVARCVAAGLAVFWSVFWFGLIDLLVVLEQDARFDRQYLLESGWGLLFVVLVTVPLVVLAARPGHRAALAQLAVVAVAVLLGGAWRAAGPQLLNGLGLALATVAVGGLGGFRFVGRPHVPRPDPALAVLAVLALPAAIRYARPLVVDPTLTDDITNGVSHLGMQASLALAVVGVTGVAAVTGSRLSGWTAAVTAAWLGAESVVYPDLVASLGRLGGTLAVFWAVLVLLAVELARQRHARSGPQRTDWDA